MIPSDHAYDELLIACPSFARAADMEGFIAAFEEEDQPDVFVRTSALALHLVERAGAGDTDTLFEVSAVIERLLTEGDEDTVELVELGLIETLQNIVSHVDAPVGPEAVRSALGPAATQAWHEHEELWREAGRWRHDGPRVEQSDYDRIADPNLRRYFQANKRRLADGTLISASDIVQYQTELLGISPLTPAGRPRVPWPAIAIGLVLALCVAVALYR